MDHGGGNHEMPQMPDHGGHGGHDMPSHDHGGGDSMECSMSMVWNTATQGMCVVFPSWHVTGQHSFVMTLVALFVIAMMLERVRYQIRALDGKLIIQHKIDSGLLNAWGGAAPRDHRRKASVQQVLVGNGTSRSPLKSDGSLGGPTLVTSTSIGDRRASPALLSSDSASFGSRSDDDAPLLPTSFSRSHRRQATPMQRFTQTFIPHLPISRVHQLHRVALYVVGLTISMFLMLVFMTYNAWLIAAVLAGAGAGHYMFSRDLGWSIISHDKTSCH